MSARASTSTTSNGRGIVGSMESLADSAHQVANQVRERGEQNASRWAHQAEDLAHRGIEAMRDSSGRLRERALTVSDRGLQYVQEQPVKAVFIAAAAGALLMALLGSRSSRRRSY